MLNKTGVLKHLPAIAVTAVIGVVIVAVFIIQGMLEAPTQQKKMVQQITFVTPPPPPPPQEKPPEPEKQEEVKVDEPQETPDEMPEAVADLPPAGDLLGLDADGGAGGDAFGLAARKGGRGLLDGLASKAQMRNFSRQIESDILDFLSEYDSIRKTRYDIELKLWYDAKGMVVNYEMTRSSGNSDLDAEIEMALSQYSQFSATPPDGRGNAVALRLVSRI